MVSILERKGVLLKTITGQEYREQTWCRAGGVQLHKAPSYTERIGQAKFADLET